MRKDSAPSAPYAPPQYCFPSWQMSLYIRDIIVQPYFKDDFLSAILSAIAYGIVVVLSGNCFHLLLKKQDIYPNRMRMILRIYVIVMLLSSTWRLIGSIYWVMIDFSSKDISLFLYRSFEVPITVIVWGADGFIVRILIIFQEQRFTVQLQIWRCLVLYQDVSRGLRLGIIVLLSFLSFASFGRPISVSIQIVHKNILVFGVATLVIALIDRPDFVYDAYPVFVAYASIVFLSLSTLVNITLAVLIVSRLVYHRRYIRNTLGVDHGSPYTNVITMCVESSALMVIATVLYISLSFVSQIAIDIIYDITVHLCVGGLELNDF